LTSGDNCHDKNSFQNGRFSRNRRPAYFWLWRLRPGDEEAAEASSRGNHLESNYYESNHHETTIRNVRSEQCQQNVTTNASLVPPIHDAGKEGGRQNSQVTTLHTD
jgi:hypothetical protein